jgi:hypothetical protein
MSILSESAAAGESKDLSGHSPLATRHSPLSLIIPVHPRGSPVSPIIPVHPQKQGGGGYLQPNVFPYNSFVFFDHVN